MKTCSSLLRTTVAAALVASLMPAPGALAQQKGKGTVSDARVAELMKMALEQAGQGQATKAAKPAAPQGPAFDLRVDDAVQRAMQNNIDLSVARLNPQIQDLSLAQTRAAYRPTVGATFGDGNSARMSTTTISGAATGSVTSTQTYTYNGNVTQVLPWTGGSLQVNWNNSRAATDNNTQTINPSFDTSLTAQVTQPLWRNFRIDSTRQALWTGIIARQVADVTLRGTALNTAANTRNAYWDLVYAIQNVKVAQQSVDLAEKLVQDNQTRVEIGTLAPLDVVTAQAQAAQARQTLVQAQQTRDQNEITLKRLIVSSTGDPLWTATINPVDQPEPSVELPAINLEEAIRGALDKRTDLIASRESLRQSEITLKYNKNQTLPDANMTASYRAAGTGGNVYQRSGVVGGSPILIAPGGYTDALSVLSRLKVPTWSVSVQLSYPIGTSAADASLARAKVQFQQSQQQLKSLELRVATDVTTAALNVRSTYQQVQTAQAARDLAAKKLEAEQSKFDVGMQTNYFVVQAQRDLASAQQSELQAVLAYRKALVNYQLVQQTSASGGSGASGVTATGGGSSSGSGGGGQ